jgi:thimet oligopeptidase
VKRTALALAIAVISIPAFAADAPATTRTTIPILDDNTLVASCAQIDTDARARAAKIAAVPIDNANVDTVLNAWDDINIAVENIVGPVAILANVHPDESVRNAGQDCLVKLSTLQTDLFQNEDLFQRVSAVKTTNATEAQLRKDLVEGFEDSGVALPKEKRERAKAIAERVAELSQEFAKNIRDNKTRLTFTLAEARGLPASYIERTKDGKGNIVVGFDYPDYIPFMTNAEDSEARKRYYIAYNVRGTARNLDILDELNALRAEQAALYGQPNYAAFVLRRRMAGSPLAVDKFLRDVSKAVTEVEKRDLEEIRKLKAETLKTPLAKTKLERWDLTYWRERLNKARYSVDQEELRKYFPMAATEKWLLDITERLYGVKFEAAVVPVWHPDVQYFDVKDAKTGSLIGGVYLDLHPREGKYTHAAAWPVRGAATRVGRKPISVLVTNLDRTGLTADEVGTLFHEFGHVMHGVLSETRFNAHAGTNVQLDFVEAPSQIYEEWARDPQALKLLAAHCSGCPAIDQPTLDRLEAARRFGKGIDYARQHLYALYDMTMASGDAGKSNDVWKRLEGATPLGYAPGTAFPSAFGHLASGYAAGYYAYMWAEVIGLDMLSAWKGTLLDPEVGLRFRKTVLARGGEEPSRQLVEKFLGREYNSDAFFAEITGKKK